MREVSAVDAQYMDETRKTEHKTDHSSMSIRTKVGAR